MAAKMLEVTVRYTDGRAEILSPPERNDEVGRKVAGKLAFDLMARDDVTAVAVQPVERYAGGQGSYR